MTVTLSVKSDPVLCLQIEDILSKSHEDKIYEHEIRFLRLLRNALILFLSDIRDTVYYTYCLFITLVPVAYSNPA